MHYVQAQFRWTRVIWRHQMPVLEDSITLNVPQLNSLEQHHTDNWQTGQMSWRMYVSILRVLTQMSAFCWFTVFINVSHLKTCVNLKPPWPTYRSDTIRIKFWHIYAGTTRLVHFEQLNSFIHSCSLSIFGCVLSENNQGTMTGRGNLLGL